MEIILFLFGTAIGSFVNVLAFRYHPAAFLFAGNVIGGRSRCPRCGGTLRWFELVPLLSYAIQGGRCRKCRGSISAQYPLIELATGLVFAFIPSALHRCFLVPPPSFPILVCLWGIAFAALLTIALIDFRLRIIPDEATVIVGIAGILFAAFTASGFDLVTGSFIGPHALLFGLRTNIWVNRLAAAAFAAAFFGFLIAASRGRGMGMGDAKLGAALGFLFGWPDIVALTAFAFIVGSLVAFGAMIAGKKTLKSFLPFGPFLVIGSMLVFFFGSDIVRYYFALFP